MSRATSKEDVVRGEAVKEQVTSNSEYPSQRNVIMVMACVFMAAFLVALDRLIIATAIPAITDRFNSLDDIGWYVSGYLLPMAGFQLLVGRIYTFYNPKWVYLTCISIFELGSLICGVAPNSTTLIVGRAVAGLGSCGVTSGAIILVVHTVPLHKRPMYTGFMGMVFGIASVVGPLLGGVFTDKLSWRWCFYINLPIGGFVMVIIFIFLKVDFEAPKKLSLTDKLLRLDPLGTLFIVSSMVCLLLALQSGGTQWSWSSWRIILLLSLFAVVFVAFVAVQLWRKEKATVPPRFFTYRSIVFGFCWAFCNGASTQTMAYYVPIWFQAIKGVSAVKSGIMFIPMVLGLVVSSIMAGILTRKIGYYTQWMYISAVMTPIGAGLISTFNTSTGHSEWIGYQVLYGLGLGLGMQQATVAAQTVLPKQDVPTGASLMFLGQTLGGSVFASVANNIMLNQLASGLMSAQIPGVDPGVVTSVGATDLRRYVSEDALQQVLMIYNVALRHAFYVGTAVSAALIIGALGMEWKSVKQQKVQPPKQGEEKDAQVVERKAVDVERQ